MRLPWKKWKRLGVGEEPRVVWTWEEASFEKMARTKCSLNDAVGRISFFLVLFSFFSLRFFKFPNYPLPTETECSQSILTLNRSANRPSDIMTINNKF